MIDGPFALALTSGMLATVNPCGFAMLPAYLSYFLGLTGEQIEDRSTITALRRALVVSAALLAGFLVVFGTFGILIRGLGINQGDILRYAKWPAAAIGVVLIVVGIAMLAGWHLPFATPRLDKGGKDTTVTSMFVFGISFAVTSLSCGAAPFIGTVMGSFTREGFLSGVGVFVMYAVGMGLVVSALTISMALAQQGVLRFLRRAMPYVDRAAGLLLILAGGYLVYYWGFNGGESTNPISSAQSHVESWLAARSTWTLVAVTGGIVVAAVVAVTVQRRRSSSADQLAAH